MHTILNTRYETQGRARGTDAGGDAARGAPPRRAPLLCHGGPRRAGELPCPYTLNPEP